MNKNHNCYLTCDIGKEASVAFLGRKDGTSIKDCWNFSHCQDDYQNLTKGLDPQDTLVAFEATGHYWFSLYEFLVRKGFEVVVLNPLQVKSFRDTGIRGSKTDRLDAQLIFKILLYTDRPMVLEAYPEKIMELRNLCRFRHKLAQQKTILTNKLIGILDIIFPEYQKILAPKSKASLTLLRKYPLPDKIAPLPLPKLTNILNKASKGKGQPKQWAESLKEKANKSVGAKLGLNTFALEIKIIIQRINQTAKQIKLLEDEIKKIFKQLPEREYLLTIPGISDVLGATILSEIGDINQFTAKDGADKLVAYAGLDGKLKESGKQAGRVKMSKRGSTTLRWAFWQAATVAKRCDDYFKEIYTKQKARHKHHYVCMGYVAKKLCRIIYSTLINKRSYQTFYSATRH